MWLRTSSRAEAGKVQCRQKWARMERGHFLAILCGQSPRKKDWGTTIHSEATFLDRVCQKTMNNS